MARRIPSAKIDLPAISKCDRIEADLRSRIGTGEWAAGMMLPSRRELVKLYGVDLSTVQRALMPLITDGTLLAQTGRGTFVAEGMVDTTTNTANPITGADRPFDARSLRHKTIGIICRPMQFWGPESLAVFWRKSIVNALERSITEAGGATRFYDSFRSETEMVPISEAALALQAEHVDGIVVILDYNVQQIAEAIAQLKLQQLPLVLVGQGELRQPVSSVYYDNRDAGQHAANHLLENGCRNLLFLSPYSGEEDWESERLAGVREAILLAGLPGNSLRLSLSAKKLTDIKTTDQFVKDAKAAADELLNGGLPAQGVIAANDYFAHGFIQSAAERGWKAGQDYAIVGFDDEAGSQALGLTSLHPPLEGMGREAGRILANAIAGDHRPSRICLPSDLVARTSSRLTL